MDPSTSAISGASTSGTSAARTWSVEDHLRDQPASSIALYRRFVELVADCGPFTYAISKTIITFKGTRRGFAGALSTRSRPRRVSGSSARRP